MTSWKQCLHPHWQGLGYVIVKSVYKYTFLNWQNTKIVKKKNWKLFLYWVFESYNFLK